MAKSEQCDSTSDIIEAHNVLLSGSVVLEGSVIGVVFRTGIHTEAARMSEEEDEALLTTKYDRD